MGSWWGLGLGLGLGPALAAVRLVLLTSELLLAATHAKVLLCLGRPYPRRHLAAQRWRYFLWDAASVQGALAAAYLPVFLDSVGSEGMAGASPPAGSAAHPYAPSPASSTQAPAPRFAWPGNDTCPPLTPPAGLGGYGGGGSVGGGLAAMPAAAAAGGPPPAAAALAVGLGHAALHAWYMATWHSSHTRQVVAMSSQRSLADRSSHFPALHVAWFHVGTAFDIATHVMAAWALAAALAGGR